MFADTGVAALRANVFVNTTPLVPTLSCIINCDVCLDVHSVVNIIARRAPGTHVVITGLYAPPTLVEAADIVTEMRMISIRAANRVWDLKLASSGSRGQA